VGILNQDNTTHPLQSTDIITLLLLLLLLLLLKDLSALGSLKQLHLCLSHYNDSQPLQLSGLTSLTELTASRDLFIDKKDVLPPNLRRLSVRNMHSVQPLLSLTQLQVREFCDT
jgi:hypothetical protein